MSAIAGILRFDGTPVERGSVERITAAMASSGPDGTGHWYSGPVALGHCMLRTTHEALAETQPLANESQSIVLVFDGRLDNREELKVALNRLGILLRSETDAELVLRAYEAWGNASPQHLLGDFAYALWDSNRQELFCAVDHMGACQMHYVRTDRFFAFASTDEALLTLAGVSPEPDEELIAHFLVPALQVLNPAKSWLKHVDMLMAGRRLCVAPSGACRIDEYWRFEAGDELQFESEAEAQSEFLSIFSEAVRCRLRASGPVAQMLSGGLDSASIRASVARLGTHAPDRYETYSAIADLAETCIESRCILSLARGGKAHFVAVPSFTGMVSSADLVREAWSKAHPCDNSILLPALMCLAASRNGTRVMLHGASGDVTTTVPHKYVAHVMRSGFWRDAWAECNQASLNNNYLRGTSPMRLFLSNAWTAAVPAPIKGLAHRLRTTDSALAQSPINIGFALKLRLAERLAEQRTEESRNRAVSTSLREDQATLLRGPFGPSLGLAGYARVGRRYGIEMRDPWGDKRVAEFFMRLPLAFKIRQGWTKHLVRTTFAADIDPQVAWRVGKEHLGWEFTSRLMDESHSNVGEIVHNNGGLVSEYLDMEVFRKCAKRYLERNQQDSIQLQSDSALLHDVLTLDFVLKRHSGTFG
jgi:asparagine synthase (glutamine-hydrolysing)